MNHVAQVCREIRALEELEVCTKAEADEACYLADLYPEAFVSASIADQADLFLDRARMTLKQAALPFFLRVQA